MGKGTVVAIVAVLLVVLVFGIWFVWKTNCYKQEIAKGNRLTAQENVVETSLDNMRKTIINQLKCTREHADKVIAVVAKQVTGREGGSLFKSNKESEALGLTPELYVKVANSIEGKLAEFKTSQDTLTDLWQNHKTFCEDPWHNMLGVSLRDKVRKQPVMISSSVTKKAVETKVLEDDLME